MGQCPFVLICDSHGAAACALPPDLNDATIGNQILDLLRRRVLGLRLTDSCIIFRPGRERPLLIVSEAGRERGNTVRFSLRRRTPPTTEPDRTADFEPMLDFDTAEPVAPPTPEPAPAESADPGATRHLNVGRTHAAPPAVSEPCLLYTSNSVGRTCPPKPTENKSVLSAIWVKSGRQNGRQA